MNEQTTYPFAMGNRNAFFDSEAVGCISAGVTFGPDTDGSLSLEGKIHRPLNVPRNPISSRLQLRLRRALFGPTPKDLLDEIGRIPGITKQEAEMLLQHGVDDLSFFAAGLIDLPDRIAMERKRYDELQEQAKRLALIYRTGKIAYLPSAQGTDLSEFWQQGIFTVNQLLRTKERPPSIRQEVWNTLRKDAAVVLERGDSW